MDAEHPCGAKKTHGCRASMWGKKDSWMPGIHVGQKRLMDAGHPCGAKKTHGCRASMWGKKDSWMPGIHVGSKKKNHGCRRHP